MVMVTFGEQIKALRVAKGLSLKQAADRIGTYKGYICSIERGKMNPPKAALIKKMASALGGDYRWLLLRAELEKIHPDVRDEVIKAWNACHVPGSSAQAMLLKQKNLERSSRPEQVERLYGGKR